MSRQLAPKRICLVGSTGLVGWTMIEQAVSRNDIRLVGITRREVKLPHGARMEMLLADPSGWADAIAAAKADVLVCALGTTWNKAGKDEAAFRAVDHDLVLACARAAQAAGVDHMIVVSSAGADPGSGNRYLRVKGETEQELSRLRFRRLDILRPGLLRGRRENDPRPVERLAMLASPLIDLFLWGKRRKYRSIRAHDVVRAVFALAREKAGGHFIHERDAMFYAIRRAGG
ncbi:MAG: NAD(P)H-binding protein [Novosphingobium sp.]|nr:NAD(P)H-binding protein [Novosphingobium sp.]MCP5402757.1 NAD(P)H-binding protein [Novosphingobium sp.]